LYLIPSALLVLGGGALMAWLTAGPQQLGGVTLDIHTMLLGSLGVLVGYQILWMYLFAKIHGWVNGLLPPRTFHVKAFEILNLERGLVLGGIMLVLGLGLNLWLVWQWSAVGMGPLDVQVTLRPALWGFTLMILGVQTIFGSFFLSMLGMTEQARKVTGRN
jgi:hypothetical protein